MSRKSIGFFVFRNLHIPHHLREFYVSRELQKNGWQVRWFLPVTGETCKELELEWPIERYRELDFKGHKILFPIYFALYLKRLGVDVLWISGWAQRDPDALNWLTRILRLMKIRLIYDTVDPIDLFLEAHSDDTEKIRRIRQYMSAIYKRCEVVISVTPEMKQVIARLCDDEKIHTCRWGTDSSLFNPGRSDSRFRDKIGVSGETFLVGWLGSMNPFKGLEEIVIPLIERAQGQLGNIHFVLAGYGLLEEPLRQWAAEHPELPVTFCGKIPYAEAPGFTSSLDAYLIPTNPASLFARSICPVKAFDSLAMGVDVLVSKTEATEFLSGLSGQVHMCDFEIDSFYTALERLYTSRDSAVKRSPEPFSGISHQSVSREIRKIINSNLGCQA